MVVSDSTILHMYYDRLRISVSRNNITFFADIRDKQKWAREMLKFHETSTMEELPEDYAFNRIKEYFESNGINRIEQYRIMQKLFDLGIVKRYCDYADNCKG